MLKKFIGKFDCISVGGATRDFFFETDEGQILENEKSESGKLLAFEYGAKIIPKSTYFSYGGGGLNTSISLSRLGLKSAALINIGKEGTGDLVLEKLKQEGVNTALIKRDPINHTALSAIISQGKDHTMFLHRGSNDFLKINWNKLWKTKWLYISSLSGDSDKNLDTLVDFKKKYKINILWNPGSKQLKRNFKNLEKIMAEVDIFIVNKAEAKHLLEKKSKKISDDEKELLKELKKSGPEIVIITDGSKGSFATDGKKIYYEPSLATEVIETTGAGDAYGSTFLAGQIMGFDIQKSMKIASINAASVISKVGSQEGLLAKEKLLKEVE